MIEPAIGLGSIPCLGMMCPCVAMWEATGQVQATIIWPAADVDRLCRTAAPAVPSSPRKPSRIAGTMHCGSWRESPPSLVPT
jgi:hypothetical protein